MIFAFFLLPWSIEIAHRARVVVGVIVVGRDEGYTTILASMFTSSLPEVSAFDDGIRTPPTPPLSAYKDTPSDEAIFSFHGIYRFVINGTQSEDISFDHTTSYGSLVQQARTWSRWC